MLGCLIVGEPAEVLLFFRADPQYES